MYLNALLRAKLTKFKEANKAATKRKARKSN
jgi:hypothetical protein